MKKDFRESLAILIYSYFNPFENFEVRNKYQVNCYMYQCLLIFLKTFTVLLHWV